MKKEILRLAIAQINCTVGDFQGNTQKIIEYIQQARGLGADLISFPELAITGYPPEDLLIKDKFITDNLKAIKELSRSVNKDIVAVIGFVDRKKEKLYNAAAVISGNKITGIYHKALLPNYGVFDEKRYFYPGNKTPVFQLERFTFAVNICEDIWHRDGPINKQAKSGARLIVNINASPYHMGKIKQRENIISRQAKENNVFISYVNLVGGQDELVFDGQSMIVDSKGKVICRAEAFKEELLIADLDIKSSSAKQIKNKIAVSISGLALKKDKLPFKLSRHLEPIEEVYQALAMGLRDYVYKNGFKKVVLGLSGGIDSALVAALAVDALGKENVIGVFMPSRYSSSESDIDSAALADNLGIKLMCISIEQIYKIYLLALEPRFSGEERNIAEENLQARIRGNILMALSNKFGWLVLTTGNKSEMSTGYATLYGDMAGGFAVIKDVPKELVYKLSNYRNSSGLVIPIRILTKEPTAELKPNQKDSDSLPVYATLDPILKAYVEEDKGFEDIVALGFDKDVVLQVMNLVDRNEYKRRQSPPGIKITPRAFGKDRRMPITNKYRG